MAIQVEVMLLHMMRIINDARRPRGALTAPTLELLSTTTDGAVNSSDALSRTKPSEIGHLGTVLCAYDIFSMDAFKPYRFLEAM
jgi:hypothetical protein